MKHTHPACDTTPPIYTDCIVVGECKEKTTSYNLCLGGGRCVDIFKIYFCRFVYLISIGFWGEGGGLDFMLYV